jgi:hypothetical protein
MNSKLVVHSIDEAYAHRRRATKAHEFDWAKAGATPFEVAQHLSAVATASPSDLMEPGAEGEPQARSWLEVDPLKLSALKAVEVVEKVIDEDEGRRVIERRIKYTWHDKLKAIQMYREIIGMDDIIEFKKGSVSGEVAPRSRGIHIGMASNDRAFALTDKQSDFMPKTNEDWEAELLK